MNEREKTAYHEAGHAVMARELRIRILRVTIVPAEDYDGLMVPGTQGRGFRPDIDVTTRTAERVEREIMVRFAGPWAASLYSGKKPRLEGPDFETSADLALYVASSEEGTNAYLEWLWIRTRDFLKHRPFVWSAVEALAKALLEQGTIGGRKAGAIIIQAEREALEKARQDGSKSAGGGPSGSGQEL